MAKRKYLFSMTLGAVVLAGCSGEPSTGPVEVKWDRDQCERCRMVLSDRHHAAQARQPMADGRSRVYRFDDFGCAVIWLDDQPWGDEPATEIWVTDYRTGEWIDARTAIYVQGQLTPMGYGLGARREPADNGLTFEQARRQIREAEHGSGQHGAHGGPAGAARPADEGR